MEKLIIFARDFINNILRFLLPLWHCHQANKIIENKMQSLENEKKEEDFEYMAEYSSLTLEEAQEFHSKSLDQMKSLEDKAKLSVIGITIAVSIITGLAVSPFIIGNANFNATLLKLLIVVFGVISVAYMSISGWMALVVLGERNIVYQLPPKYMRLPKEEKIKRIALYTELNVYQNIIRNNYVYAAYRGILYAIISLSIMFILISVGSF